MVAANEQGQHGRLLEPGVVLPERAKIAVLLRHGHGVEIFQIAHGLKVTADDEQVEFDLVLRLQVLDCGVDHVKFAMTASFDRYFHSSSLFLCFSPTLLPKKCFFSLSDLPSRESSRESKQAVLHSKVSWLI